MTTTTNNRRYVTLSFQHKQQTIIEAYEIYRPEFDSPHFQGSVLLKNGYDPDWHQSENLDLADTEIDFYWKCLSSECFGSFTTYLDNPDELSSIRHITNIFAVNEDLYVVELN